MNQDDFAGATCRCNNGLHVFQRDIVQVCRCFICRVDIGENHLVANRNWCKGTAESRCKRRKLTCQFVSAIPQIVVPDNFNTLCRNGERRSHQRTINTITISNKRRFNRITAVRGINSLRECARTTCRIDIHRIRVIRTQKSQLTSRQVLCIL